LLFFSTNKERAIVTHLWMVVAKKRDQPSFTSLHFPNLEVASKKGTDYGHVQPVGSLGVWGSVAQFCDDEVCVWQSYVESVTCVVEEESRLEVSEVFGTGRR
jgi:hypothetical protein